MNNNLKVVFLLYLYHFTVKRTPIAPQIGNLMKENCKRVRRNLYVVIYIFHYTFDLFFYLGMSIIHKENIKYMYKSIKNVVIYI